MAGIFPIHKQQGKRIVLQLVMGLILDYLFSFRSMALLLQVALPVTFYCNSPISLELKGGTNCEMAPQVFCLNSANDATVRRSTFFYRWIL